MTAVMKVKTLINNTYKYYRSVFPANKQTRKYFEKQLSELPNCSSYTIKETTYVLNLNNGYKVVARDYNHSDYHVFRQLFIDAEYAPVCNLLKSINQDQLFIIDAGANVGYSSLYFHSCFSDATVFCIEPSPENALILEMNMRINNLSSKTSIYKNALAAYPGLYFTLKHEFRDQLDWSITTEQSSNGKVPGITINDIISENRLTYISLLKIDIEGAERFIFKDDVDLSFLKQTYCIAIELHDEFDIKQQLNEILLSYGFELFEHAQTTYGINKKLVA